jgi:hypothetical protein
MTRRLLALPLVGLVLAGCSGGGGEQAAPTQAPSPQPVQTVAPLPTCPPAPTKAGFRWPKPVPTDLPVPPGGTLGANRTTQDGLTIVEFRTTTSLQQGATFLVQSLKEKGYTLGRGDAEATEADAPFLKADLRGVYRMIARSPCQTDWLLAITRRVSGGTGSPLLPMRPGAGSPSPLPFG